MSEEFDYQAAQAQDELEKKEQLLEAIESVWLYCARSEYYTKKLLLLASALGLKKEFDDLIG